MKSSDLNIRTTKFLRKNVVPLAFALGKQRKFALERWLRGREEYLALEASTLAVVSYGKSGRTWLRTMITHYYCNSCDIETSELLEFDNLHRINAAVPKIFFTHDNYLKHYCHSPDSKRYFYNKPVILQARNPIDVAVSQYFHWQHRMSPAKKELNQYPLDKASVSLEEFIFMQACGLPEIVRFMNLWAREFGKLHQALLIRFEDMKADPFQVLSDVIRFIGSPYDADHARNAVEQSSFDRMKSMESSGAVASGRLSTQSQDNPDAFKVRKGKVGGYRDYFDADTVLRLEQYCDRKLAAFYGYDFGTGARATHAHPPPTDQ